MFNRKYIAHIFYVYSEASLAVFYAFAAIVEFLGAFLIGGPIALLLFAASALFTAITIGSVMYIVRMERKYTYRSMKWSTK